MSLEERVYSVLVVSAAESFNSFLQPLLPDSKFDPIRYVSSVNAARQMLLERQYDFVVINSPLPDDTGIRFSIDICSKKSCVAVIFARSELYATIYNKVAEHGVYILPKPSSKSTIVQGIDWMITTRERLKKLEKKNVSLEDKMQEIRLVNRAKWFLIEHLSMSEADAHRYIEKQAMDNCVSKREIAEDIIRTYS